MESVTTIHTRTVRQSQNEFVLYIGEKKDWSYRCVILTEKEKTTSKVYDARGKFIGSSVGENSAADQVKVASNAMTFHMLHQIA